MRLVTAVIILAALTARAASADTADQPQLPKELQGVGIDQRLDAPVPLDTRFVDESGRSVALREYFGRRPVILALVYYRCTMLCSYILNGVVTGLRPL